MKNTIITFAMLLLCTLTACASIFGNDSRTVQVNSDPAGATVFLEGNPVGTTPTLVQLPNSLSDDALILKMDGYEDENAQIHTGFQPIGLLNLALIPVWPFLPVAGFAVDAISGRLMKVSPDSQTINMHLRPLSHTIAAA